MIPRRFSRIALLVAVTCLALAACSMNEEIKRIEAVKQAREATASSRSSNLTGEQIFIRSCNTCHPGGRKGYGPTLENMDQLFKTDADLKAFLRTGKGKMPGEPLSTLNEKEMDNLVDYLHKLTAEMKEDHS
ncbi:MAG TPA: cytochrome c [Candidatus Obscuribacterales bacterium]